MSHNITQFKYDINMLSYSVVFNKKNSFIIHAFNKKMNVLNEGFLKTCKPLPQLFLVKFPDCSEPFRTVIIKEQSRTAASLLSLLLSSVN